MIECGGSMGRIKIPYYTVIAGRGYWRPTRKMRSLGFQILRCGADGPQAWALADDWNKKWQAVRIDFRVTRRKPSAAILLVRSALRFRSISERRNGLRVQI
jgi:hypothetical protein